MAFECKAGTFAIPSSTGNLAITGIGFQPKVVLFFPAPTINSSAVDFQQSIGFGVSSSSRYKINWTGNDGVATSAEKHHGASTRVVDMFADGAISTSLGRADFVSQDSDGFTLNWTVAPGAGEVHYMALGGDDLTNVDLSSFTSPSSTGNQAYTGIGFQPDLAIFFTDFTTANQHYGGWGMAMSSSSRFTSAWQCRTAVGTTDTARCQLVDSCIATMESTTAILTQADLVTFDSDGFTLNWSKVSGTRTYQGLFLRGGQYSLGVDTQ